MTGCTTTWFSEPLSDRKCASLTQVNAKARLAVKCFGLMTLILVFESGLSSTSAAAIKAHPSKCMITFYRYCASIQSVFQVLLPGIRSLVHWKLTSFYHLQTHTHIHTPDWSSTSSFCSAALTGWDPSLAPLSALLSPLVHPHKSLMMCRLHRAGLSNDIITISNNLLLPYGPTSCDMLHRAGRCLPQTEIITLRLFFLAWMTSERLCVASVKKASALHVQLLQGILWAIAASRQFKQKPCCCCCCQLRQMMQQRPTERTESHAALWGYVCNKRESNTLEDMILIWLFVAREGEEGSTWCRRGSGSPPQHSFKYCWTQTHTDLSAQRFLLQH